MNPAPVTMPLHHTLRIGHEIATRIVGAGETALLAEPLLAFIASGFHSPLEQQGLRSMLRRKGRVVKVLARGMCDYQPTAEEREPLAAGC